MRNRSPIPWRRRRPALPIGERHGNDLTRELEHMLDRVFHPPSSFPMQLMDADDGDFGAVDISEKNGAFKVSIDLPGVEEDDIDLEVSDHRLTVKASRSREAEEESDGYHHVERAFGSFARSIELPDEVDPNSASATFKKGVLSVKLEKSPDARDRTRKIAIGM